MEINLEPYVRSRLMNFTNEINTKHPFSSEFFSRKSSPYNFEKWKSLESQLRICRVTLLGHIKAA
jgi:hypothetical protein